MLFKGRLLRFAHTHTRTHNRMTSQVREALQVKQFAILDSFMVTYKYLRSRMCSDESERATIESDIMRTNATDAESLVREWHAGMLKPLDSKDCKYANPVQRILKVDATVLYVASQYRDSVVLYNHPILCTLFSPSEDLSQVPYMSDVWDLILILNGHAASFMGYKINEAPSREEIRCNIIEHRQRKALANSAEKADASGGGVVHAFADTLRTLFTTAAISLNATEGEPDATLMDMWKKQIDSIDNFDTLCNACDATTLANQAAGKWLPEFQDLPFALCRFDESQWTRLQSLNSMCRVSVAMPSNMLKKVEQCANELSSKIAAGEWDLASLSMSDLSDIGRQVLGQCDDVDIENMTMKMPDLLSCISSLQKSIK